VSLKNRRKISRSGRVEAVPITSYPTAFHSPLATGDPRGFDLIVAILGDRPTNCEVHEISSVGLPGIRGQIRQDRYYAGHLLGELKDSRAIPILLPFRADPDVKPYCSMVPQADC